MELLIVWAGEGQHQSWSTCVFLKSALCPCFDTVAVSVCCPMCWDSLGDILLNSLFHTWFFLLHCSHKEKLSNPLHERKSQLSSVDQLPTHIIASQIAGANRLFHPWSIYTLLAYIFKYPKCVSITGSNASIQLRKKCAS